MSTSSSYHAAIAGGGLAGSLLALFLARRGMQVTVLERRPDLRVEAYSGGRSINLALSVRGLAALQAVGLEQEVLEHALPMAGRAIHDLQGNITFSPYGTAEHEVIYSISRSLLNRAVLAAAAREPRVQFHFRSQVMAAEPEQHLLRYQDAEGREHQLQADVLFGTDGAGSALRDAYFRLPRFNYSQDYLSHGYKELHMQPDAQGGFRMRPDALHIWPRGQFMLIALPNPDYTFTCTLFLDYEGPLSFQSLDSPERVQAFVEAHFPDLPALIPDYLDQFRVNPTSHLATIRCAPWNYGNHALLLGDAAHAIVPFYGQGMNCSFEDVLLLDQMLATHSGHPGEVFAEYAHKRKPDADAIAQLALENFVEMRDKTADPHFCLKHALELELEKQFPDFKSKYGLVTFSRVPYSLAHRRGNLQDDLLGTFVDGKTTLDGLDRQHIYQTVQTELALAGLL